MSSGSREEKKAASEKKGEEEEEEEASKEEGDDESGGGGDEEEEEEYLPAEEKKRRDSASAAAAAAKKGKDGAGSADGGNAGNAEYDDKMEADRCKRFDFLLKQTEIFGHFMQEAGEKRAEEAPLGNFSGGRERGWKVELRESWWWGWLADLNVI